MKKYEIELLILGCGVLMGYIADMSILQGAVMCAFMELCYLTGRRVNDG